ncbi:MAG: hypothetical protein ACYS5W_12800 [Planctomycetota bacterium]|jgi:proteasome lid subunit RPN8/RPN11
MITPIYIQESADEPWPQDSAFYLVSGSGLFLCRNHEMFRSCTPVRTGPSELPPQQSFLEPSYPKVPQVLMEQLVGFFDAMASRHCCEAGAYLVYDETEKAVTVRVPPQVSTVREGWSDAFYPVGLDYENLDPLLPQQLILGTVHSHVYGAAYSSGIDVHDEVDKPGVHIVVGKLDKEPADFHAEAVVDGSRFRLELQSVIENYQQRRDDFPAEWIEKVTVEVKPRWRATVYYPSSSSYHSYSNYDSKYGGGYGGSYRGGGK